MLSAPQIVEIIGARFGSRLLAAHPIDKHPRVHIESASWRELAEFVFRDERLRFDWLANLSGIDYAADGLMCVCYDLWSFELRHSFAIKVYTPREHPRVESVADIWRAADWHEREVFDLLGIDFPGHPDLRRIVCSDDWVGHPLRKDYEFPSQYHGIPAQFNPVPPARKAP